MATKTADSKGRIALGKAFAGSTVIVTRISPIEVRIVKARVIPEDEAWLWENPEALQSVRAGLKQAENHEFAEAAPDIDADASLLNEIDD